LSLFFGTASVTNTTTQLAAVVTSTVQAGAVEFSDIGSAASADDASRWHSAVSISQTHLATLTMEPIL
jgi:hypothetical protein